MKVLSIDPGAERCGWALINYNDCVVGDLNGPQGLRPYLMDSGVLQVPREGLAFQPYRLRAEKNAVGFFGTKMLNTQPRLLVTEIVPARGLDVSTQLYLASCVAAAIHAVAYWQGILVDQIAATKVQKAIGIPGRTGKITKVGVRNGVHQFFPQLKGRKLWPDETDAIAVGLAFLGLKASVT